MGPGLDDGGFYDGKLEKSENAPIGRDSTDIDDSDRSTRIEDNILFRVVERDSRDVSSASRFKFSTVERDCLVVVSKKNFRRKREESCLKDPSTSLSSRIVLPRDE